MKMYYGNVPIKSMNVHHFEMDTNDATLNESDLQTGITAYARGRKVTGTGKCFEFASYGNYTTNRYMPIPTTINVIEVTSLQYPVQALIAFADMETIDFAVDQTIGNIVIDNIVYPLILSANNGMFKISCEKTVNLEVFYGKDNYA